MEPPEDLRLLLAIDSLDARLRAIEDLVKAMAELLCQIAAVSNGGQGAFDRAWNLQAQARAIRATSANGQVGSQPAAGPASTS